MKKGFSMVSKQASSMNVTVPGPGAYDPNLALTKGNIPNPKFNQQPKLT
jgi:hypothetical protein